MLDSESNQKAKLRLQACILRKNDTGIRSIARKMNRPYTTIYDWLTKIHNNSLEAIYNKTGQGVKCKLTPDQLADLMEELKAGPNCCGFDAKIWTAKLACIHTQRKYKIKYTERGMYGLLIRIGFFSKRKN